MLHKLTPMQALPVLIAAIERREPVCLIGPPATAKSALVAQAAAAVRSIGGVPCPGGARLVTRQPVTDSESDYKGQPDVSGTPGNRRAEFLPYGDLRPLFAADCVPTVLFGDDLIQAPPRVQACWMPITHGRELAGHKLADTVSVICATNSRSDKAGGTQILEPLLSRMTLLEVGIDVASWLTWARADGIDPSLIDYVAWRGLPGLYAPATGDPTERTPNYRQVATASRWLNMGLVGDALRAVLTGCCGEAWTTEYLAFSRSRPVSLKEVLADPSGARVPEEASALTALCREIGDHWTPQTDTPISTYLSRCPAEIRSAAWAAVRRAHPDAPAVSPQCRGQLLADHDARSAR